MRRRISLYIAGRRADLGDDGFVLLNIALQNLTNPAVIRNSWTQEVELPRTPDNDKLFGASFRLDRNAGDGGAGTDFNASKRVPFSIYYEVGEILFAGYAKLGSVTRDAYRVSLYGGLGDFLYGLSYGTDGEKRSLATLDYGEELDFDITAQTVAEAWARLGGDTSKPEKWDIINFAPAYNGIPDDFNADKALVDPGVLGITTPHTMDGVACDATKGGGNALLNLTKDLDEWQAHDLRSYLQRPVLSVRKLLAAIASPYNNGGWSVDLSDLAALPQLDTWLTRPLLPSLGTYKQSSGAMTAAFLNMGPKTASPVGQIDLSGTIPAGTDIKVNATFGLSYQCPGVPNATLYANDNLAARTEQVLFVQAVAYASDNTKVAASKTKVILPNNELTPEVVAAWCVYTPDPMNTDYYPTEREHGYAKSGDDFIRQRDISIEVTGQNIAYVNINITAGVLWLFSNGQPYNGGIAAHPYFKLWTAAGAEVVPDSATVIAGTVSATATSGESLRSGAHVTQEMLLSTSATPADYLLSLCKMLGLYIIADGAGKSVRILTRSSFYSGVVLDITNRVDAPSVEIQPLAFDAKWYEWKHPSVGGRFEKQYQDTEGVQYGIQRVDTGYDFDAQAKDVLAGSVLKSAAPVQERGPWWMYAYDSDTAQMWFGPLMNPGNEFTLWDAEGKDHQELAASPTDAAAAVPYNPAFPGYDVSARTEFRDADNKAIDGADVLLFYDGDILVDDFNITDDLPVMDTLLGGPCWILAVNNVGINIPAFTRYAHRGQDPETLLDFGFPREVDVPGIKYTAGVTVYEACWQQYIRDRLSVHGKVMRCRMLLDGLQVGPELLRRFYWYQGSLWSLVSVSNHSLTTFDPAECEFVQVRDTNAYI